MASALACAPDGRNSAQGERRCGPVPVLPIMMCDFGQVAPSSQPQRRHSAQPREAVKG